MGARVIYFLAAMIALGFTPEWGQLARALLAPPAPIVVAAPEQFPPPPAAAVAPVPVSRAPEPRSKTHAELEAERAAARRADERLRRERSEQRRALRKPKSQCPPRRRPPPPRIEFYERPNGFEIGLRLF